MQVEVSAGGVVAIALGQYLGIGVNVSFLDCVVCGVNFHQYHRQISGNFKDVSDRHLIFRVLQYRSHLIGFSVRQVCFSSLSFSSAQ